MTTDRDLWLWWRNHRLHWLSPLDCGSLPLDLKQINHRGLSSFANLRSGVNAITLQDCVGDTLCELVRANLPTDGCLTLHLGHSLPAPIQSAPWVWCNLDATPMHARVRIEYWSPEPYPRHSTLQSDKVRFFDLWHESLVFLDYAKENSRKYGIKYDKGFLQAENTLNHVDLSQYAALIITAHGTENSAEQPLIDDRGHAWSLPLDKALPPLIIISACGSECGNLTTYAHALLDLRSIEVVIAPVGKIDATAMVNFIDLFLAAWFQGETVHAALAVATLEDVPCVGAARLCVFGNGALCIDTTSTDSNEDPMPDLNLLTLQRYQAIGDFSDTVYQLYRMLKLNYDDPHESDQLFRRLHALRGTLWPVTTIWLAPYMARLAQQHNHGEINYYRRLSAQQINTYQQPDDALFYYYLAGSEYRQGRYVAACQSINRGLQVLSSSESSPYSAIAVKLWGSLINILIDLNLSNAADKVSLLVERALQHKNYHPLEGHETDRFIMLDRQARIAVRHGNLVAAKEQLRRKWQLAKIEHSADGLRELATLALVSAWDGLAPDDPLIQEVKQSMPEIEEFEHSLQQSTGLNKYLYVLKGLSAIAWQTGRSSDVETVASYIPILRKNYDYLRDSGAIGACIFYSAIAGSDSATAAWPAAEQWLADDGYFFELAVYCSLFGDTVRAQTYLKRFHTARQDAVEALALLPVWDGTPNFQLLVDDLTAQELHERMILISAGVNPVVIKDQGLIPL